MTCDVKDKSQAKISTFIVNTIILSKTAKIYGLALLGLFFCFVSIGSAQSGAKDAGKITGKVIDSKTGEPIIGANVSITGTTKGAATDLDGNYTIQNIDPGIYSITISYISYTEKNVTGVEVDPERATRINVSLRPQTIGMDEVTVTAEASQSSEAGLLAIQRKSVPMQDGISSEQISKIGDGSVAGAMRRVTGVTVRNGKNIYVRGLGNRYSNIQLNGSQVPSTDPNKKEAPTDLFGTGLVESIVVQKTYTADQFAEFSGGSVKIETKQFPYERNFTVNYTTSYNTVSTFENTLTSPGSSTDFIGYDDGKRALPSFMGDKRVDENNATRVVRGLHNDWNINGGRSTLPSQSVSVNYANQFNENTMPIGIVSNFSYKFSRELQPDKRSRFIQFFNRSGKPNYLTDFQISEGTETAELSGMLNLFAKPSSVTKVGLKTLYTNSATSTKSRIQGPTQNFNSHQTVLDFDRRSIFSLTLEGETYFKDLLASTLSGHIGYNRASRVRPDRRRTSYNQVGDAYRFEDFGDGNGHFFSDQEDNNYSGELKYKLQPTDFLNISMGGNVIVKDRRFISRRISYRDQVGPFLTNEQRESRPAEVLADANVANGILEITETTQFGLTQSDWYDGFQAIYAGFVSTKWELFDRFSFEIGGRVEQSTQIIDVPVSFGGKMVEASRVENIDFLPALNMTYQVGNRTNIRGAFSQTLARPEFREISNFSFADFLGGQKVYGNPDLKQTNITNYDLRVETYPGVGQMFAASIFYKHFKNPIEKFYRLTEANEVQFGNAPEADLYGFEIEGRQNITERLQVVANASYIYSRSQFSEDAANRLANIERPMVGQSPYIVNASVFYTIPDWETDFSVSYNTFGKRIVTVGKAGQQFDEYEQPFHDLGAKISYSAGQFDLSLEASNLLNDERVYKQGPATTFRYKPGMTFNLGITISL